MIKLVAAFFLVLGSGLIFRALIQMDTPSFRPRHLARQPLKANRREEEPALPLRRAA
jgi:hypothetical protein